MIPLSLCGHSLSVMWGRGGGGREQVTSLTPPPFSRHWPP